MDEGGVGVVGNDLGDGDDRAVIHDDGIAFGVAAAAVVAVDGGDELLVRFVLGHRAGDGVRAAALAVEVDLKFGHGKLLAVGHDLFVNDQRGVVTQRCLGHALGRVDALDLRRLHFHV